MYRKKISLYLANPKKIYDPILPLLLQSRKRNQYADKITAVFSFQRLIFFSLSFVRNCRTIIMDLTVHLALRGALNSTTTLST